MNTFEAFEQALREALIHLYDPVYQAPPLLRRVLTRNPSGGAGAVQPLVIAAIQELKPSPEVPPNARSRRLYELLACRYVQELTQEETAERLGITPRHLRREQQQAVQMLARRLWEQYEQAHEPSGPGAAASPAAGDSMGQGTAEPTWRSQVHRELAALEENDPGAVANVAELVEQVVRLEKGLAARHGCRLEAAPAPAGLVAAIHPSVLRQLLIVAVQKLAQATVQGVVKVAAWQEGDCVRVEVSGEPAPQSAMPASEFIAETVTARGGQVAVRRVDEQVRFEMALPSARLLTVLVVDDNADLVHLYRRYTERTRYRIVHVAAGQEVFEAVRRLHPDVVVLDVMLPDLDGWEVLTRLHEDPDTRAIPVIVCSVVRQEELALALGATGYVPKPVRRQDLIQALDRAAAQDSTAAPPPPASTAAAC
ncbi:MAG TPA: response regulator [Caldilineaceae bacterium]|nr:response regulator [Caldilineaceae bacterium]